MSTVVPIAAPFSGGLNTRERAEYLAPNESPGPMENVIFGAGVAQERNGYPQLGVDDPLSGTAAGARLTSVRLTDLAADQTRAYVVTDTAGKVGVMRESSATVAFTHPQTGARPQVVEEYGAEVLIVDRQSDDTAITGGANPILRFAGCTASLVSGTGTVSVAAATKRASGSGTNFNPNVAEGSYILSTFRVTEATSDTELGLYNASDVAAGPLTPNPLAYGYIGLRTLVDDEGVATHGGGSPTVTGKGTSWASGPNAVRVGDVVLPATGQPADAVLSVTAVNSDTSLTVSIGSTDPVFTDSAYVILRPACGSMVCAHDNRLWIAGVPWARDNLYLTPAGYDMGNLANGAYSTVNDAARALQLFSQYVPSPGASGEITGLCSSRLGLLVGRSGEIYTVRGEYPSLNVSRLHTFGCFAPESMVSVDDVVFVAGEQGIFQVTGGKPLEITAPRRYEYLAKTDQAALTASQRVNVALGIGKGILYCAGIEGGSECWAWDIAGQRWLGNLTVDPGGTVDIARAVYFNTARLGGEDDACVFVADRAVGDIAPAGALGQAGQMDQFTNRGRFVATLPPSAFGPPSQLKTITGLKVAYVLDYDPGFSIDNPAAVVSASADDAPFSAESPVLGPNAGLGENDTPETVRIHPGTGQLGVRGRSHRVKIERTVNSALIERFAVSAIEASVRAHRVRS